MVGLRVCPEGPEQKLLTLQSSFTSNLLVITAATLFYFTMCLCALTGSVQMTCGCGLLILLLWSSHLLDACMSNVFISLLVPPTRHNSYLMITISRKYNGKIITINLYFSCFFIYNESYQNK